MLWTGRGDKKIKLEEPLQDLFSQGSVGDTISI